MVGAMDVPQQSLCTGYLAAVCDLALPWVCTSERSKTSPDGCPSPPSTEETGYWEGAPGVKRVGFGQFPGTSFPLLYRQGHLRPPGSQWMPPLHPGLLGGKVHLPSLRGTDPYHLVALKDRPESILILQLSSCGNAF